MSTKNLFSEIPNEEVGAGSFVFFATVITVAVAIIICGIVVYKRALSKSPSSNYTKGKYFSFTWSTNHALSQFTILIKY